MNTKIKIIVFSFVLINIFCVNPKSLFAAPVLNFTVNGEDSIVTADLDTPLNIKWSTSGVNSCYISGSMEDGTTTHSYHSLQNNGEINTPVISENLYSSIYVAKNGEWVPKFYNLEYPAWMKIVLRCNDDNTTKIVDAIVSIILVENNRTLEILDIGENEIWYHGEKHIIKWLSDKDEVPELQVTLEKVDASGNFLDTIYLTYGVNNKNKYTWVIPDNIEPGNYRIGVSEAVGGPERANDESPIIKIYGNLKNTSTSANAELNSKEKLDLVERIFGKNSEIYEFVELLISLGII